MVGGGSFSVPVLPKPTDMETIDGHGTRLDGRHYEEFRSVCEYFSLLLFFFMLLEGGRRKGGSTD
jgi:hypothetical protein